MTFDTIAIAGSGVIGSSWAIVYARAGCRVAIYERDAARGAGVVERIRKAVEDSAALLRDGDDAASVAARITVCESLSAAVTDADFVHECIEEKVESKVAIFAELDRIAPARAVLATTTSSFPVSQFAADLACRDRCIVVHPATPPHLLPVTEICPAPFTAERVSDATTAFMKECGQSPVRIKKELPGFVLNRMQAALVVEMLRLLRDDAISPRDIDTIISQGFGLRWAFLGPFEGVDLNASGGIRQYLENFGFLFNDKAADLGLDPVVTPETIDALDAYARDRIALDRLGEKVAWRDRAIVALRDLKAAHGTADET